MLLGDLRLRRFSDAPLALLFGTPAKRVKEIGAPSLKHPFARVFTALRPFAAGELKRVQCGAFPHKNRESRPPAIDWLSLYQS
jgi:hypothetical protein